MKKTRRASAKNAKSSKGNQARGNKAKTKAKATSGGKSSPKSRSKPQAKPQGKLHGKPERFPVRGARKSKVASRSAAPVEAAPSRANRADLDETRQLAIGAIEAALDKNALGPVLIDVSGMGSYTDFIGIVSGRSDRQVDAIAENVRQVMKERGRQVLGQEGSGNGRWTLLDFGAFVVHVFYHPVREFYDLESLWIEAPRVKLDVPPEATLSQPDALYGAL